MEPEGSLPCSEDSATGSCSEPDAASPHPSHPIFLKFIPIYIYT
jgi:hypothetical protein